MDKKGKGRHCHNVRRLERDNAPRRRKYALFIGQYHTNKHAYCLEGRCIGMSIQTRPGLLRILSDTVGCYRDDKELVLSLFGERFWIVDMFANKDKARHYSKTGPARSCDRQVEVIWRMVMEEKGVPPAVVIPAMKRAPSSCDAYYGKRELRPADQRFGVKMFSAIGRHPELGPLFEPVFLSPWPDRTAYRRRVRRIPESHGLIARSDRRLKRARGSQGRPRARGRRG